MMSCEEAAEAVREGKFSCNIPERGCSLSQVGVKNHCPVPAFSVAFPLLGKGVGDEFE